MTKRLISLMLAVLMLAFVFTSCGNNEDALENTVNDASRYTSTINLWVITESELVETASELLFAGYDPDKYPEEENKQTDEQKAFLAAMETGLEKAWRQLDDVCDQINVLTKKRFKTQVNIRYYTEASYYAKLEAAFIGLEEAKDAADENGTALFPEIAEDETVKNEQGVPELKYPTALDSQVDIVFVSGSQNYFKYVNNGWLTEIKSEDISNSAPQLTYHLTSALLSAPKANGKIYAIPNNNPLGEYTYLALDSALVEKYYADVDAMENSIYSDEARAFLDDVYNYEGISPIYSANGEVDFEMLHYWYFNEAYEQAPSTFSLFGGFYTASSTPAETLVYRNVFTLPVYTEALETKVYYENTANYITNDASAPSAARVVKGTASDKAALEAQGYTVLTVAAPRIADEDVFDSMFAIGAITRDKSRNLEIIAMLNTEPEIRNLLQYGIEGVNYTLKTVHDAQGNELGVYAEMKADNAYVMDIAKTGNMFVAYPNAATSDFANGKYGIGAWDDAKKQNLDATLYPTLGLNFSPDYELDVNGVRMMSAVSAQFNVMVMANITSTERVAELRDGAIAASAAGYEAMAAWILGLTGPVTYVPVGGKTHVVITVEALAEVLEKMDSSYNDSVEYGAVLSPKALYEEWWLRNYGANANQ